VWRGRFQQALVLVTQRSNTALSRKLGGVVEPVDVWDCAGKEGFFEQLDDAPLEEDDLTLDLCLRNH
jgi:hypothetical protein